MEQRGRVRGSDLVVNLGNPVERPPDVIWLTHGGHPARLLGTAGAVASDIRRGPDCAEREERAVLEMSLRRTGAPVCRQHVNESGIAARTWGGLSARRARPPGACRDPRTGRRSRAAPPNPRHVVRGRPWIAASACNSAVFGAKEMLQAPTRETAPRGPSLALNLGRH